MRVDGYSSNSYPVKRKPRKASARLEDDNVEDIEFEHVAEPAPRAGRGGSAVSQMPARPQDNIFPRSMSSRVALALSSYMTTAAFVEWDDEVLGLDVHI